MQNTRLEGPHGSGMCFILDVAGVHCRPAAGFVQYVVSPIVRDRCIQLAKSKWIEGTQTPPTGYHSCVYGVSLKLLLKFKIFIL